MNLKQVIDLVDSIEPNAYSNDVKTAWINECEGSIQTDVFLIHIDDVVQHTYSAENPPEMMVKPPHDRVYRFYLQAMIQFANAEYDRYTNTMQIYNAALGEFIRWVGRTIYPAGREALWNGYYIGTGGRVIGTRLCIMPLPSCGHHRPYLGTEAQVDDNRLYWRRI